MPQKKFFDEMTPLVFFSVMLGISAGPLAERNDGLHIVGAQSFAQPASNPYRAVYESVEAGDVVPLAWQKHDRIRLPSGIDDHRDLRQAAA
jgi:hypothetical protein